MMLHRRTLLLTTAAAAGFIPAAPAIVRAEESPGVTATEIRLGNTMPYSGPASAYGTIGKGIAAMFKMANDAGRLCRPRASTSSPMTTATARPRPSSKPAA